MEAYDAVKAGVYDVALSFYGAYIAGKMPEVYVETGLPFAWENMDEAWDAYYNWGLYERLKEIYYNEMGVYWFPVGVNAIGTNYMATFDCTDIEAVVGRKVRAVGMMAPFVQNLGGIAVNITPAEWYMQLKLGTVDGVLSSVSQLEATKLKEVMTHVVMEPNIFTHISSVLINKDKWDALPEDIKTELDLYSAPISWAGDIQYAVLLQYQVSAAVRDYGIKVVNWTGAARDKCYAAGMATWDEVAAKSPRTAELVEIVKKQARLLGKID